MYVKSPSLSCIMTSIDRKQAFRDLLIAQEESFRTLTTEFHQQVECYIKRTNQNPLTKKVSSAAQKETIILRNVSPTTQQSLLQSKCLLISQLCMDLTRSFCNDQGSLSSVEIMQQFLQAVKNKVRLVEDKVQVLFILDSSMVHRRSKDFNVAGRQVRAEDGLTMLQVFELEEGFDQILEWLALSCSYRDPISLEFTSLVLHFLLKHQAQETALRKTLLARLQQLVAFLEEDNKLLLKEIIDMYRKS
uniref:Uncharacterized protein AlNc14C21G2154 n=1 Tax=Albugo laibachii Nc14 TaxID=890382 RepID=F0W5I9_9STRA|nr:conserved hypothetical protein [Albugo laibachii Nc14]|eukprot:CCA16380.1 conserved hypothetical protein [Albugo laibachii Nc14]